MEENRSEWQVHLNIFAKHIAHDLQKGIDNQVYSWHNVTVTTSTLGGRLIVNQLGKDTMFSVSQLGTEALNYIDNQLQYSLTGANVKATMTQQTTITKGNKMNTNSVVNNVTSTLKTVGQEIQASAITSAKMEAGEAILLALRNIVMQKAGFMQKVKFKFAPIALDVAVTLGADILVAELLPNKKSAKIAVECLNLAMTKELIHALPIQDFTNALTGGKALETVTNMLSAD